MEATAANTVFVQVLPLTFVLLIEHCARQNLTQIPNVIGNGGASLRINFRAELDEKK